MSVLAIIPARSGSKGLKDKNIRIFDNKPLIAHTIEYALKCTFISEVMVSTDSELYKNISLSFGAKVPFLRSEENSSDSSSSWEVVKEVLINYRKINRHFTDVVLLQPTSPLRNDKHINECFSYYLNKKADFVASICEVDHSPLFQNTLPENKSLYEFIKLKFENTQRQRLDQFYRINGSIYIVKTNHLLNSTTLYNQNSFAYLMEKRSSFDIDDEFDFELAEAIFIKDKSFK
jgi:CMP-N,N'-diacetyllegionaminic acid synthase